MKLPGTTVSGNEQRLTQVMINLFSNAKDASKNGGRIWATSQIKDLFVIIKITDEGSGIPAEHLSQIFEPFFTTKEAGVGTGLGLALVYSIIEEHYGNIQVKSPAFADGGTCFTITLASASASDQTS